MTVRLIDLPYRELHPTVKALSDAGMDEELARLIRQEGGASRAVAALRRAFEDEGSEYPSFSTSVHFPTFPVFMNLALGHYQDQLAYRAALQAGGYKISASASYVWTQTGVAEREIALALVCLRVREMGFVCGASHAEIYTWIEAQGLKKCPAEVGPALRLVFPSLDYRGSVYIGMEPVRDERGYGPSIFCITDNVRGRWLSAKTAHVRNKFGPACRFIFVARES